MKTAGPATFDSIARDARGHFLLHFYAAVSSLLAYCRRLESRSETPLFAKYPFLSGYQTELERAGVPPDAGWDWWENEIAAWEDGRDDLPLLAAAEAGGIDFPSRLCLLLISLGEIDSRFGTLFAEIQAPLTYRRPCLETLGHVLADAGWDNGLRAWDVCQGLLSSGLAEVTNQEAPRSEWQPRVPALLWDLVQGHPNRRSEPWCALHAPEEFAPLEAMAIPDSLREHLGQVPALLATRRINGLILRGAQGSERLELMGAVAAALGLGVAEIHVPPAGQEPDGAGLARHLSALGPLCVMSKSLPVFTLDLGPGETVEVPRPPGYTGPCGVILGAEGGVRGPLVDDAMTLSVPLPGPADRERVWRETLAGVEVDDLADLVDRYHLPTGYIRQAGKLALAHAALEGKTSISVAHVRSATRSLNRQILDTLATRIEVEGTWNDLVVNETTARKLQELEVRCLHREALLDRLGPAFQASTNRGVRALFSGSSGTGKSLSAKILAAVMGIDLYRVDLSAVVNKYIGETEKNLNKVLSRAEELDVVLLLDEGDSLLGGRTDVKSANDRYANLETNYLLQRLEHYEGILIITTNANQLIDRAFQRRIDVVVSFVPPNAMERMAIWRLHLPTDHTVSDAFLMDVAHRCALSGGQIRNAALNATLLALPRGAPVREVHLVDAIEGEYRKAGALCPLRDDGHVRRYHGGVDAFVSGLRDER